jgi:hypothetical protein
MLDAQEMDVRFARDAMQRIWPYCWRPQEIGSCLAWHRVSYDAHDATNIGLGRAGRTHLGTRLLQPRLARVRRCPAPYQRGNPMPPHPIHDTTATPPMPRPIENMSIARLDNKRMP